MSKIGTPDTLSLHLPATTGSQVTREEGNYDFSWYPQWGLAIAFLGHHIVAVYSAERDTVQVGNEIAGDFREWAKDQAERTENERIALTERGRIEANVHAAATKVPHMCHPAVLRRNPTALAILEHESGTVDSL